MSREADRRFFVGAARATGGAIIFGLPLFMTLEMWQLGVSIGPLRMLALLGATLPMLVFLSAYSGFEGTARILHDVVDAFVAIAIATLAAAISMGLMAIITPQTSWQDVTGKLALQIVPGSVGALLAQSQFGARDDDDRESEQRERRGGYGRELALMAAGALFLGLNIAPTEEVMMVATQATPVHMLLLAVFSALLMHGFVYAVEFRGHHAHATSAWSAFIRFTLPGFAIALGVSAFMLWVFGRFDGQGLDYGVRLTVALGFPASIGAAAARLIL